MPTAGAHKPRKRAKRPVKSSGLSAAARRRFEREYGPLIERMVDEAIEDRLDALDGLAALKEPGEVAHDEFWKVRGQ